MNSRKDFCRHCHSCPTCGYNCCPFKPHNKCQCRSTNHYSVVDSKKTSIVVYQDTIEEEGNNALPPLKILQPICDRCGQANCQRKLCELTKTTGYQQSPTYCSKCGRCKKQDCSKNCCHKKCDCSQINSCPYELGGIQVKLILPSSPYLEDGKTVIFDQIYEYHSNSIIYNKQTGRFTLTKPATYLVNWNVVVEGSNEMPYVRFAILIDGALRDFETLPVSVGQLNGSTLVTITKAPAVLTLINYTHDTIQFSRYAPSANLTITQILCI